ncbi:MAG: DUF1257 domain-containing protein [Candidatus Eremiobacterota bacterium]
MSHFTTVKTKITDRECVKKAIKELGYNYSDARAEIKGYQDKKVKADIAVKTGTSYDIGIVWNGETCDIVADWWGVEQSSSIKQKNFIQAITQKYACLKTKEVLSRQGFTLAEEEVNENREIVLTVRQW